MKTLLLVSSVLLAIVLLGERGLLAADRGRGRDGGSAQWYADPDRGWVRTDESREGKKEERRESSKDRRSNHKDRDKGKGRGSKDY